MAVIVGTSSSDTLHGTAENDVIYGRGGDDRISGHAGVDTLYGEEGDDFLDGGAGADVLYGGSGWDGYVVDHPLDRIFEERGHGRDSVRTTVDYTLPAGQEIENMSALDGFALRLTGNEFDNIIHGSFGPDIISGGPGADRLFGLAGNDTYYVDSLDDVFEGDEGYDRVAATQSFHLTGWENEQIEVLEAITLSATNRIDLTGNWYTRIVAGNNGTNFLRGRHDLFGYGGDDFLAPAYTATAYGGPGNDTYYFDGNPYDDAITFGKIVEYPGEGYDRVATNPDYTLPRGVSVEVLEVINSTSTYDVNLGGNEIDNLIAGNNGINIINGDDGNDTLVGYGGADTLKGEAGDDTMFGGSGSDKMIGGAGSDYYYVEDAGDVIVEEGVPGYDWVASSVSYTLGAGVDIERFEPITLSSTQPLNLTGNEFGTYIIGNNGANVLDGKGGMDVLEGLGGADTFEFTTALGAGNIDQVADFQVDVDKITLGGTAGQPFAALPGGQLSPNAFVVGSQATSSSHRIIYNPQTGTLSYDADGAGGAAAVQFATLSPGLALTAGHFTVRGGSASQEEAGSMDLDGDRYDGDFSSQEAASPRPDLIVEDISLPSTDYFVG